MVMAVVCGGGGDSLKGVEDVVYVRRWMFFMVVVVGVFMVVLVGVSFWRPLWHSGPYSLSLSLFEV